MKYTYKDEQIIDITNISHESLFKSFTSIGGQKGWLTYNILWQIRGKIDSIIGGVGMRGREHPQHLKKGDKLDFWTVHSIEENSQLVLRADMKAPGRAWLKFKIIENKFIQTAYFDTFGLTGKLYWYFFIPFHNLIFPSMAKKIVQNADIS